jgi:hypothetical protein
MVGRRWRRSAGHCVRILDAIAVSRKHVTQPLAIIYKVPDVDYQRYYGARRDRLVVRANLQLYGTSISDTCPIEAAVAARVPSHPSLDLRTLVVGGDIDWVLAETRHEAIVARLGRRKFIDVCWCDLAGGMICQRISRNG